MQGMSWASLKKNPSLIPLYVFVGAGVAGAAYYILRLATRNPDVSWSHGAKNLSNEAYRDKQYKFYAPNMDYSKIKSQAPKYEE